MSAAVLSVAARRDLMAAVRWITKDNPVAAQALLDTVAQTAERIGNHIYMGRVRTDLAPEPYRFVSLTSFSYIIVYNADRNPPLIVRILHTSRDLSELLRHLS
jgi:toxin ParE1/3/4